MEQSREQNVRTADQAQGREPGRTQSRRPDGPQNRRFGRSHRRTHTKTEDLPRRRPVDVVEADYHYGLNQDQVSQRINRGWDNRAVESNLKTTGQIVKENILTYFNLIFAILTVLLILVRSFRDLSFLIIIVANTLIGIAEEIYAKNVLEKMNMLEAPQASVMREGKLTTVPTERLVRDDIVLFGKGSQICADAVVVQGEVRVNEALLTGESDEITKAVGDKLISGSFVVTGECYARLTEVGQDSYISKLTIAAKTMQSGEESQIFRALNRLLIFVGIALVPIGLILFLESYFLIGDDIVSSVTSMVAAVIGLIPEGLFLLTSAALGLSAVRLARERVLFHDLKSIETLARVDVLCLDKTGTITENTMKVRRFVAVKDYDQLGLPDLKQVIGDFAHAMKNENSTIAAIKEYFTEWTGRRAYGTCPFTSDQKYSGAAFETGTFLFGAPEVVLRDYYSNYENRIRRYMSRGYRVLAFVAYDGKLSGGPLTASVTPLGLILLSNPVREGAAETFSYFAERDVAIKVISGDNPLTVSEAAREAKIKGAENFIDARKLKTEEDIDYALERYTVFGRVNPAQKRQFIQSLKKQGHTVAMTGDGINDVLALKDADCSIAMASGSEVASQVAQVVLLDSDFSRMPDVVREGRRVVNNIQRSGSLFLVRNIFSLLLALFSAITMITYPLSPSQITLISLFTIGVPAFLLAMEENDGPIGGRFLPNILVKALPAGLTDFIAVGALVIFGQVFGIASEDIATASTMLLAIVGFIVLVRLGGPMNRTKWIIWLCCIGGLLASSIFLPHLFNITGMSLQCVMLFVVFGIATEPVLHVLTLAVEGIRKWYHQRREQEEHGEEVRED